MVTTREEVGTGQEIIARMYTSRVQIQSNGTFWEFLRVVLPSGKRIPGVLTYVLPSEAVEFALLEGGDPRNTST